MSAHRDGIPVRRRSPIAVLTGPDVRIMTQTTKTRALAGVPAVSKLTVRTIAYRRRRPCRTPHRRRPTTCPTRCRRRRRGRARRRPGPARGRHVARVVGAGRRAGGHLLSAGVPRVVVTATGARRVSTVQLGRRVLTAHTHTHTDHTTVTFALRRDETRDRPALTRRYSTSLQAAADGNDNRLY